MGNTSRDGILDHITCLLRNLHAGQEEIVRLGPRAMDWFHFGKGVHQSCILSTCLFNLYYMQSKSCKMLDWMKHRLEKKITGRNINNPIYADDTTIMAESKEELRSLLMQVKKLA